MGPLPLPPRYIRIAPIAALPVDDVRSLLARVMAGEDVAWTEFVERFAPLLLSAARTVERDRDAAADAFVFACEQLRARRFARLRVFDATRPGTFETWLRAVALNLCVLHVLAARRRRALEPDLQPAPTRGPPPSC